MKKELIKQCLSYLIIFFIGIFLMPIKNFFVQKFYTPKSKLGYSVDFAKVIDNEKFIKNTNCFYYDYIVKDFPKISELYVCYIEIKNMGNKELKFKEFYEKEQLKINVETSYLYGAYISNSTKNYIDATVDNIKNNTIYIKFDTIEPHDSIYINILVSKELCSIKISGKSKEFDRIEPIDYKSADICHEDFKVQEKLRPKTFIDFLPLFLIIILILSIFLKIKYSKE